MDGYLKLLGPRTRLCSVVHVSNALGTVNSVREIIAAAHAQGVPVLLDGAQALAHRPVDVRLLDCDFYAFSGHKLFGPIGIGVLYGKRAGSMRCRRTRAVATCRRARLAAGQAGRYREDQSGPLRRAGIGLHQTTTSLVAATRRSETLAETLARVAPDCPVTGLTNRRRFQEIVHVEWRRLMREGRPLSLIMFDLDDGDDNAAFYRSVEGSACLCRIAEVARGQARRAGDTTSRYGETRFGILLPGANTATARRIAEDLRRAIEAYWIAHPIPGASPTVTVHVGVATLVPSPISKPEDLLDRAEDAMYQAAFQGGNRVVSYQTLDTFGLVRWDPQADGTPTEQALVDKLFAWDYRTGMTYQSPDKTADRCPDVPWACAVVSGRLGLSIEGQSFELDRGDCLFLPRGKTYSEEVLGNDPVWLLEASKSS